ncbi:MAG: hypothetical protein ACOH1Y_04805 [Propionicimonas sp.]
MRVLRYVLSILASVVLLTVLAPPAQAAVPKIPLTCGLVVKQDALVVLKKDLTCPAFGVQVVQDLANSGSVPHVTVDLRGHTLRGSGMAIGINANNPGGSDFINVVNGRLENWDNALSGDWDTRTRNVSLVGNRLGWLCSGICVADRTRFTDNTDTGFFVGGEASGTVTHSIFVRNAVGASVLFPWTLSVDRSLFVRNRVGVLDGGVRVPISKSLFVKNTTAIRVEADPGSGACAALSKVVFIRNGVRVDGPVCTS